ncbi:MAG: hypothetical protein COV74_02435 [Candidatus Omnitrophica bacterium CG11_big_fil_rev_8_21_14_0_20_45_26]|uniref:Uncharacterized protein n=1 Tax=Candidatus Abzuiibacterium crystallinum TaxID=1974748 RepID=A0A2H0LRH9_9BACT|nr:MAG: hypothetical protein COV74_02435 [Candidatus Omnitrophica bacterium CG11_big_fil_rev_8_21_14_0_20_45_26]PIW65695.1 MAG: hypothetical protein COW12_00280 [Candidatus Omnitrophica bacterium CG12_big_fil_rev_8_21_14_0_65_45_16]
MPTYSAPWRATVWALSALRSISESYLHETRPNVKKRLIILKKKIAFAFIVSEYIQDICQLKSFMRKFRF